MKHLQKEIAIIHNVLTELDPDTGVVFDKLILNFRDLLDKKQSEIKLLKEDIEYLKSEEAYYDL